MQKSTLKQYKTHAEKFGTDQIYETAEEDLTAYELGQLAMYLYTIKPPVDKYVKAAIWKLDGDQKERLALALTEAGIKDLTIERMCKISRSTLIRYRQVEKRLKLPPNQAKYKCQNKGTKGKTFGAFSVPLEGLRRPLEPLVQWWHPVGLHTPVQ